MSRISKAPDLGPVPPRPSKMSKAEVQKAVEDCYGLVTLMAVRLDASVSQCQRLVEKYGLGALQAECQRAVLDKAKAAVLGALDSPDEKTRLKAAEILLRQAPQLAVQINAQQVDVKELFGG